MVMKALFRKHQARAVAGLLSGLLLVAMASAQAAKDEEPDSVELETLTVEGKTLEFTHSEIVEIKNRIVAIGLSTPKTCLAEKAGLLVCRPYTIPGSHLKGIRCQTNEQICKAQRALAHAFANPENSTTTNGGGEAGSAPTSAFQLGKVTATNSNLLYSERTSYTKIKKAIAALPGRPEDNLEILDAMLDGWPSDQKHPDEATLRNFARAYIAVGEIGDRMDPLVKKALSRNEQQSIIAREDDAMENAIKAAGLELKQYNRLSEMSQRFTTLRHRLRQFITEERAKRS